MLAARDEAKAAKEAIDASSKTAKKVFDFLTEHQKKATSSLSGKTAQLQATMASVNHFREAWYARQRACFISCARRSSANDVALPSQLTKEMNRAPGPNVYSQRHSVRCRRVARR